MIAVQPDAKLGQQFDAAGGDGEPQFGQVAQSYDPDPTMARSRAREQFRWFAAAGRRWRSLQALAALPRPQQVDEDDVAKQVPCGDGVDAHVRAARRFVDAGFTHVAVVQIGGETQPDFLDCAERELLPALRQ